MKRTLCLCLLIGILMVTGLHAQDIFSAAADGDLLLVRKLVLPMGHQSLHRHFAVFMDRIKNKFPGTRVACPRYGGDRIHYVDKSPGE